MAVNSLETVIPATSNGDNPAETQKGYSRIDPAHERKAYQRTSVRNRAECKRHDHGGEHHDRAVGRRGEHGQHSSVGHRLLLRCAIPMLQEKRALGDRVAPCTLRGTSTASITEERGTDVEVEGGADDGKQPQDSVEPAHVAVQPAGVAVDEWLEYQVKGVN